MIRLAIVVEGQTEAALANRVLMGHLRERGVDTQAILGVGSSNSTGPRDPTLMASFGVPGL